MRGTRHLISCAVYLLVFHLAGGMPVPAHAEPATPQWSDPAQLAAQSLLLDVTRRGLRAVAVGERGHVLISEDAGRTWNQVLVPVRSMLTATTMTDPVRIWVVGHDAVILHSDDGGKSWTLQTSAPEEDAPLLDVWFKNRSQGIAVGAYGLYYETQDGGQTWQRRFVDDEERHWNAITEADDGTLFVAAEFGTVFRSSDGGAHWKALQTPYEGSLFGIQSLCEGSVIAVGLRGNLLRSDDNGDSWQHVTTGTDATLMACVELECKTLVVVGLGGTILKSEDAGLTFEDLHREDRVGLVSAIPSGHGPLILVGEQGIHTLPIQMVAP